MHVMKILLFNFEETKKVKDANTNFKYMVKSKFTFSQYFRIYQTLNKTVQKLFLKGIQMKNDSCDVPLRVAL